VAGPGTIIPDPIAGGLGPSAAPRGPTGVDYRQLQQPEEGVPSWALSRDAEGVGHEAQALGQLFREFEGISNDVHTKVATQAGAIAGAASGATGHPQYRQGLERFTAYSQAFNNAATGAYAVQAEAQADDAAARLRVQANNDPAHFATTYSAVRDAVLKQAPAQAVPILTDIYNKRLAEGVAALSGSQAAEQQKVHRDIYMEGIARQTSRVAALDGAGDPHSQAQAADELTKLSTLIEGGANAGLYSKDEATAMHVGAMRAITSQVFETQIDNEIANGGDPVGYLQRFMDAHQANLKDTSQPALLSNDEYQKLIRGALTKMYEHNATIAFDKKNAVTVQQLRFQQGDQDYTVKLLTGQLTMKGIAIGVANGDIKPEIGRSLRDQLLHGSQAKSDPRALYEAYTNPENLDWSSTDVLNLPGISDADKLKLVQHIQKQRDSWDGTQQSKHARQAINAALKIPPGTPYAALSEDQRTAALRAQQEYTNEMNAADPAKRVGMADTIAQKVVAHVHQQQAVDDLKTWGTARQNFISMYGPAATAPMDTDRYQARLKYYDQQISQAQAAAKVR